jgi:hypothetical protein
VLGIDCAGNPMSVRDYPDKPTVLSLERLDELNAVYDWLYRGQPAKHPLTDKFPHVRPGYKTLVIDTITDLQRTAFIKASNAGGKGPGDLQEKVGRDEFGSVLAQMVAMARMFTSLDINVIMNAQEMEKESNGITNYRPFLWGQSASEVPSYFAMVIRLVHRARMTGVTIKEAKSDITALATTDSGGPAVNVALLTPTGRYYAKDTYGTGRDYMVGPTMAEIVDAIDNVTAPRNY